MIVPTLSTLSLMLVMLASSSFTTVSASFTNLTLNAGYGTVSYTAACNQYKYFRVVVQDACVNLNISVTHTKGDPKLFVSRDKSTGAFGYPTITGQSWSLFRRSSSTSSLEAYHKNEPMNLIIEHWDPDFSPGNFDIGIYGDCSLESEAAVFQIAVSTFVDDSQDLLLNPSLGMNQLVTVLDYKHFRFCIPVCADVTVTLENCLDSSVCPTTYSYPELLTSRTNLDPQLYDYRYVSLYNVV